jgi:hypothetical protein
MRIALSLCAGGIRGKIRVGGLCRDSTDALFYLIQLQAIGRSETK